MTRGWHSTIVPVVVLQEEQGANYVVSYEIARINVQFLQPSQQEVITNNKQAAASSKE